MLNISIKIYLNSDLIPFTFAALRDLGCDITGMTSGI